jgi:hypothetical protein
MAFVSQPSLEVPSIWMSLINEGNRQGTWQSGLIWLCIFRSYGEVSFFLRYIDRFACLLQLEILLVICPKSIISKYILSLFTRRCSWHFFNGF